MPRDWRIPRRSFLRGLGASVALPALDAMAPAKALSAAAKPPVRMACLFFPNGVWRDSWIPRESGYDYVMPFSLEPLEAVRDDVLVFSGLDKAASRGGDGHYAKTANFLTGTPIAKTTGKDISVGGVSMDQLVASRIGGRTPLPSLELAIDPVISGVDSNVGYTRLYGSYISWRTPEHPVAREIDPRAVYGRLFGIERRSAGEAARRLAEDRSLVDVVLDDAKELRGRLGRDDQFKLDEYMDSLRSVEKRIEFALKPDARDWRPEEFPDAQPPPPGIPTDYREHVDLMFELLKLAFRTDSTRVSTFMFANSVSGRGFKFVEGVHDGHHHVSHHEQDPAKIEQYRRINRWHVERFARFLADLRSVPEGEGTLLDNCMILMGSGISDGNSHDPNNLPILLGGRGGGAIRPGRHIASPKGTPLCNLYMRMLDIMETPVERFGDGVEAMPLA